MVKSKTRSRKLTRRTKSRSRPRGCTSVRKSPCMTRRNCRWNKTRSRCQSSPKKSYRKKYNRTSPKLKLSRKRTTRTRRYTSPTKRYFHTQPAVVDRTVPRWHTGVVETAFKAPLLHRRPSIEPSFMQNQKGIRKPYYDLATLMRQTQ
jgi:hypothetical protein